MEESRIKEKRGYIYYKKLSDSEDLNHCLVCGQLLGWADICFREECEEVVLLTGSTKWEVCKPKGCLGRGYICEDCHTTQEDPQKLPTCFHGDRRSHSFCYPCRKRSLANFYDFQVDLGKRPVKNNKRKAEDD